MGDIELGSSSFRPEYLFFPKTSIRLDIGWRMKHGRLSPFYLVDGTKCNYRYDELQN